MTPPVARRGPWRVITGGLVAAALLWPALLAASTAQHLHGRTPLWAGAVYLAASRICHQRPERSFHLGEAQWPVCARCSGLYAAAPIGALAALPGRRRRAHRVSSRRAPGAWRRWLAIAACPTVVTLILEWSGLSEITNVARAIAALPLGVVIAWAVVDMLPIVPANQVH